MTSQNTSQTDSNDSDEHRAAGIETIQISVEDVLEAFRRNDRDQDEQQSHVLRVTPPLEGTKQATLYVHQAGNYYPPDMSVEPVHLSPEAFLTGEMHGFISDDVLQYPNYNDSRSRFRDEYDIPMGETFTDEQAKEFKEWWEEELEVWEYEVRHALVDEIFLETQTGVSTTVAVEYAESADPPKEDRSTTASEYSPAEEK